MRGIKDPLLLAWAAGQARIIVTHDVNTLPKYTYERIRDAEPVAGVIIVPEDLAIGTAISELAVMIECSKTSELENQVKYLPI